MMMDLTIENLEAAFRKATRKFNGHPKHRAMLRDKGWSYRVGAKALGVTFTHLHRVLTGERQSQRLLEAIENLPHRTLPRFSRKS